MPSSMKTGLRKSKSKAKKISKNSGLKVDLKEEEIKEENEDDSNHTKKE